MNFKKNIILNISLLLGLFSSSPFVGAQIRVIDNKGTISTIDASKWTRIGATNDIYNKFPGNVGLGTNAPVATLHNAGSTLFSTLTLANFAANGTIGTAAATVDAYTSINIPQTTAGITLSIPVPTNTTAGRILQVSNTGTTKLTVGLATINSDQTVGYVWNGTAWSLQTSGSGWGLTGNAGTTAGANFVGSTDAQDVVLKANNTEGFRVMQGGDAKIHGTISLGYGAGSDNTILGKDALISYTSTNTLGNYNTAIGSGALRYTSPTLPSYSNVAIGYNAGSGLVAGNNNIFIGSTTSPSSTAVAVDNTLNLGNAIFGTGMNGSVSAPAGNIGIKTAAPNTTLDVNGDVAVRMGAYTAANGTNNNIVIGNRSFIRITGPTTAFTITGIAGGYDGKMVILYNTAAVAMTIANNNAGSLVANRIYTLTGGNFATTAAGGSAVTLIYDATSQRWIVTDVRP